MSDHPRLGQSRTSSFLSRVDFRKVVHQRSDHRPIQLKLQEAFKHMRKDGEEIPKGSLKWMFSNQSKNRTEGDESLQSKLKFSPKLLSQAKTKQVVGKKTVKWFDKLAEGKHQDKETLMSQHEPSKCKTYQDGKLGENKLNELKLQPINKLNQHIPSHKSLMQEGQKIKISAQADKIKSIDEKLGRIIQKRLSLLSENTLSTKSAFRFSKESLNQDLRELIQEIKLMRDRKQDGSDSLDQKIRLIETLIAQQITQGQLMRKYYYNVNSKKSSSKIGGFDHLHSKVLKAFRRFSDCSRQMKSSQQKSSRDRSKKSLFSGTTNTVAYKQPLQEDYEAYRFKHPYFEPNPQPLPRSSYKRQFLVLKSLPNDLIVNRDSSPYYPIDHSPKSSSYNYDYKCLKGQIFDHKQLDAYQNKFKTLEISYLPKNKLQGVSTDKLSYYQANKRESSPVRSINFNKHMLMSEAKRSFAGESQVDKSRIKHQQLKEFEYRLKSMYKA